MEEIKKIALNVLKEVGYPKEEIEKYRKNLHTFISSQSADIAMGVDNQGAGDQGMMYGYACRDTKELMPLPIMLAHGLCKKMAEIRKADPKECPLLPDGKAQVTVAYTKEGKPDYIDTIVVSTQHKPYDIENSKEKEKFENYIIEKIIRPIAGERLIDWSNRLISVNPHQKMKEMEAIQKKNGAKKPALKLFINPTGKFEVGGAYGDCGVTGRKIVVDGYGGVGRVGGGCFSGKDPSKVDRSAAYMARYLAKLLVQVGFGDEMEICLSYAIGVAQPVDVAVDGKLTKSPQEAYNYVRKNFDLSPQGIIKFLDLKRPIYRPTAAYGHFGREEFSWEQTKR